MPKGNERLRPKIHDLHEHVCPICGAKYVTMSEYDHGMCHNCRENVRLHVIFSNPSESEIKNGDIPTLDSMFESVFFHLEGEFDADIDDILQAQDMIYEIIGNNMYKQEPQAA